MTYIIIQTGTYIYRHTYIIIQYIRHTEMQYVMHETPAYIKYRNAVSHTGTYLFAGSLILKVSSLKLVRLNSFLQVSLNIVKSSINSLEMIFRTFSLIDSY